MSDSEHPARERAAGPGRAVSGDSGEFWTRTAERYHQSNYGAVKKYPALLMRHRYIAEMFDRAGGTVLDVGCGPGEMIIELLGRGCRVYGTDIAPGMVALAGENLRARCPGDTVPLSVGSIERLEHRAAMFDAVICAGVIEYLNRDDEALRELNRVLKPGGTLLISVRNKGCVPRVLDPAVDLLKSSGAGRRLLGRAQAALKGGETREIVFTRYRKHFIREIDGNLRRFGFEKADCRYFHFYPFLAVLEKVFPGWYIRAGLAMERLQRPGWGWLASGYVVKARKVRNA